MDELWRLISVEGLYQLMARQALQRRELLSREQFRAVTHTVVMNLDQLLDCLKYGIIPIPQVNQARPALVRPLHSRN